MDHRPNRTRRWTVTGLMILLAGAAYVAGWRETEIDPAKLVRSLPNSSKILSDLVHPDLVTRATHDATIDMGFPVPCGASAVPMPIPLQTPSTSGVGLALSASCGNPGDSVTVAGAGMAANADVRIQWVLPDGGQLFSALTTTDASGRFSARIQVRPTAAAKNGVASRIEVRTSVPVGGMAPSQSLKDVINNIMVTIFMALLATTAGTLIAAPVSFFAARNIMGKRWPGRVVYALVRGGLNLTRSYDSLVLATVFALWVGFGPFAGVLALTVVTVASLGKLFSEAVETIDPGPSDAVRATGAGPVDVVRYAVVPQVVPDFVSYIIYHWDINVRISTILGFVGGGGIGYYLSQRLNVLEYRKVGTAIWAIVIVVWAMDFLSAEVRKRFT